MSRHTPGAWRYCKGNDAETLAVISIGDGLLDDTHGFATNILAQVMTDGVLDPEANARLIAAAPEMYYALTSTAETLSATENFMEHSGFDTSYLKEIVSTIEALLERIDAE